MVRSDRGRKSLQGWSAFAALGLLTMHVSAGSAAAQTAPTYS
jgi:hypothetical protein